MKIDDQILIKRIAEENSEVAFKELYDHYFPGLLSFILSFIKDKQQSEEIICDVFFKIWLNRSALPSINNLASYIYVSAKNTCINFLKSKRNIENTRTTLIENAGDYFESYFVTNDDNIINKEILKEINEAIEMLPPRCKLVYRLVKDEELKYAEVADLLDISVKAVEKQMMLATKKLMGTFADESSGYYLSSKKYRNN